MSSKQDQFQAEIEDEMKEIRKRFGATVAERINPLRSYSTYGLVDRSAGKTFGAFAFSDQGGVARFLRLVSRAGLSEEGPRTRHGGRIGDVVAGDRLVVDPDDEDYRELERQIKGGGGTRTRRVRRAARSVFAGSRG